MKTVYGSVSNGLIYTDDSWHNDSYEISLADLSIYDETVSQITAIEGVESVSNYSHVAETLSSLDRVVRYGSVGIVAVLAVVSTST